MSDAVKEFPPVVPGMGWLPVLVVVLLGSCSAVVAGSGGAARVPQGAWGGPHIRLEVSADGVAIEQDCASGRVEGAIPLAPDGTFDVPGTYTPERPGPTREGESREHRARFSGRVGGSTMTLTIRLVEGGEVGPFTLELGRRARITKCL